MSTYEFVALLLVVIGPVLALARATGAPPSLVLFGLGLASAAVPGVPPPRVDPQLVLNLFLPPLVYASIVRISWHLLRFTLVPGIVFGALIVTGRHLSWSPCVPRRSLSQGSSLSLTR